MISNPALAEDPVAAMATLPLSEVIQLFRDQEEAKKEPRPAPPLAASLTGLAFEGRLFDDGAALLAKVEISVLESDTWVSVPLFYKSPGMQLIDLPSVPGVDFGIRDDYLHAITKKKGRHRFEIELFERAQSEGLNRNVELTLGDAVQASLIVSHDAGLFRLNRPSDRPITPVAGKLSLAWRRLAAATARAEQAEGPAVEPVIALSHASSVSTLEGKRITRLRYELNFAGAPRIGFQIPAGQRLERVYLNGSAVPLPERSKDSIELDVAAARAGDEGGTLELVLTTQEESFHLSGNLAFEFPSPSWPTNEFYLDVHLPAVFDYAWRGGSLSPVEHSPETQFSHPLPLPGRSLHFHQYLISASKPDVSVDYTVNLDGHYFQR